MNPQNQDTSALDATIIGQLPGEDSLLSREAPAGRIEIVSGSVPRMETETQALLRIRLRAAAIVLLLAVGAFFFRGFFFKDAPARWEQGTISVTIAVVLAVLSSARTLTLDQLRQIEAGIFWLILIYLGIYEYKLVLAKANAGSPIFELAAIKSCILYFFAVILLYGTFIPNTWQRAARMIIPLTLTPFIVIGLLRLSSTTVDLYSSEITNFEQISDNVIMMTLGAVAALYGTHIINALRVEAFKARQMGQYRLKERLGAGGMGEVYLAEHCLLKRPCAIKLIRQGSQADPLALARFEREVRATARLSHWNTVNIYDYGHTDDGTFYYVMEYLWGLSLADLVERHGPLPPARAIHLLRQTCRALHEAHCAGMVHRDIKPANIFATRLGGISDVAKLLDFGLVRQTVEDDPSQGTESGRLSGSPLYMAPEQGLAANNPDVRSDIYSLGASAYYLLTGRAPFGGTSIMQVMAAHARDPVESLSQLRPEVPADLESIVLKCLSKCPGDRFPDAFSLEQALADCRDANGWTDHDAKCWWKAVTAT